MKKIIISVVLLAVAAGGIWYWRRDSMPADAFRTAPVKTGEIVQTISATGPVEPEEVVDVGAQVSGIINTFGMDLKDPTKFIDYRSEVKKGMLLALIDPQTYQADLDTAKAEVEQAKATVIRNQADLADMNAKLVEATRDWERAQKIGPSDALSENDYDMYQANYEIAKANVAVDEAVVKVSQAAVIAANSDQMKAQRNLDFCTITAPVDGVIIDRRVNIGQTVVSSLSASSLFLLAKDLRKMQVWASVNEADVGSIYPGQKVTFNVSAFPSRTFTGTVGKLRYNATVTSNVVIYTVEIEVDNSDLTLIPYLTANAQFIIADHDNVMTVPDAALHWLPQVSQVAPEFRDANSSDKHDGEGDEAGAGSSSASPQSEPSTKPSSASARSGHHFDHGVVWVEDGKYVKPIRVRVGITDGANTEISTKDPDALAVGTAVIVGDTIADQGGGSGGLNPFMPQFGRNQGQERNHRGGN